MLTELDIAYELTGPNGIRCVWNDQADPDYVGVITEVSGLDAPEMSESAENLVQEDGGMHGDFFYNRRPVVIDGLLLNPLDAAERNARMLKISAAADAMRSDALLRFQPTGMEMLRMSVRKQNGPRFAGQWQKTCQVGLVADDPRIYSDEVYSASIEAALTGSSIQGRTFPETGTISYGAGDTAGQLLITNTGNTTTYPILTITGPGNFPALINATTGATMYLTGALTSTDSITIDTNPLRRTIILNNALSVYSRLKFVDSTWWGLVPGVNDIQLTFASFSTGAAMGIQWRNAWI
jgi:hypothetical protein